MILPYPLFNSLAQKYTFLKIIAPQDYYCSFGHKNICQIFLDFFHQFLKAHTGPFLARSGGLDFLIWKILSYIAVPYLIL